MYEPEFGTLNEFSVYCQLIRLSLIFNNVCFEKQGGQFESLKTANFSQRNSSMSCHKILSGITGVTVDVPR